MLLFCFSFGFYACNSVEYDDSQNQTPSILLPDSVTPTINVAEKQNTITPSPSMILVDIDKTPTKLNEMDLEITIINDYPGDDHYKGLLILMGYENPDIIFNLANGETQQFSIEGDQEVYLGRGLISPDNKKIAYFEQINNDNILTLRSFDGSMSDKYKLDHDWYLNTWTPENKLLLTKECTDYQLIDPQNGDKEPIGIDLPKAINPLGEGAAWYCPVFSPDLSRVVYLAQPEGDNDAYANIVLWNLQSNQRIVSLISGINPFGGEPVWSQDGNSFILTLNNHTPPLKAIDELFKVTNAGEVIQLTHLGDIYSKLLAIQSYQWSPENSQIAFWLSYGWDHWLTEERFAVHNLLTQETTIYNLQGDVLTPPVWSPDGDAVVIVSRINGEYFTILVDLSKNIAYKIAGDYYPVGWVVTNP